MRRQLASTACSHLLVAEEGGGFGTKVPAHLDPNNDETCPSRDVARSQARGRFGAACGGRRPGLLCQGGCRRPAATRAAMPRPSVNGLTMVLSSASCTSCQRGGLRRPQVSDPDVACCLRAAFPADAGDGTIDRCVEHTEMR